MGVLLTMLDIFINVALSCLSLLLIFLTISVGVLFYQVTKGLTNEIRQRTKR